MGWGNKPFLIEQYWKKNHDTVSRTLEIINSIYRPMLLFALCLYFIAVIFILERKIKYFTKHKWEFYSKLHLPEALIECRRKQPFPCFPAEQHHLSQGCHLGVTGCELCHSHPAKLILSCRCAQCQAPKENNNKFQQSACENNWFSGPLKCPVFINKRGV